MLRFPHNHLSNCKYVKQLITRNFHGTPYSKDCLYLNIYTPALPVAAVGAGGPTDRAALKPVMVWIHGGGFIEGGGGEYYPCGLVEKEVVVVTLNYRLASLGFLTFGNSVVGGNMGLKDQLEALRWVQRYIHNFGGDPAKVGSIEEGSIQKRSQRPSLLIEGQNFFNSLAR